MSGLYGRQGAPGCDRGHAGPEEGPHHGLPSYQAQDWAEAAQVGFSLPLSLASIVCCPLL